MINFTNIGILAQTDGPALPADEMAIGIFVVIYLVCIGVSMLMGLLLFAFWIWMLIDCVSNEPSEGNDKLIWILVIVLTSWLGAAIYYFVRRPKRMATVGK